MLVCSGGVKTTITTTSTSLASRWTVWKQKLQRRDLGARGTFPCRGPLADSSWAALKSSGKQQSQTQSFISEKISLGLLPG